MNRQIKLFCSFVLLVVITSQKSFAVQIAFFQSFNAKGEPIVFEGLYSHTAISYKGQWLHAHPYFGIKLTADLRPFGPHYKILENIYYPEPSDDFVEQQLQKKFNIFAHWDSPTETYCSKLVGQALKMSPTKMHFQARNWQQTKAASYRGQLGLSPSDIYWYARRNLNFKSALVIPSSLMQTPARLCHSYLSQP